MSEEKEQEQQEQYDFDYWQDFEELCIITQAENDY